MVAVVGLTVDSKALFFIVNICDSFLYHIVDTRCMYKCVMVPVCGAYARFSKEV